MKTPITIKEFISDCYIKENKKLKAQYKLPATMVFTGLMDEDYQIYFLHNNIEYCIPYLSIKDRFFCHLNNSEWFTEEEVTDLADWLGLQIICAINRSSLVMVRAMESPDWEVVPYINLYKRYNHFVLLITQPFATYDAGADLPYIHRIAIVELSEEFKSKIGF